MRIELRKVLKDNVTALVKNSIWAVAAKPKNSELRQKDRRIEINLSLKCI